MKIDTNLAPFLTAEITKSQRLLNEKHKDSYAKRKQKIETRQKQLDTELAFLQKHTENLVMLRGLLLHPEKFEAFIKDELNEGFINDFNQYLLDIENLVADMAIRHLRDITKSDME
jgi:hypothetical protein